MKHKMTDEEFDSVYKESECNGCRDQIIAFLVNKRKGLQARAEAAESLVVEKDKALEFIRDECDWEVGGDHWSHGGDARIGPACTKALALTPATVTRRPVVFTLGEGKYCVAQSNGTDGCPALTIRKLEKPVEVGTQLESGQHYRVDYDLIVWVKTPEAASVLLVVAQAIAFAHGVETPADMTSELERLRGAIESIRGHLRRKDKSLPAAAERDALKAEVEKLKATQKTLEGWLDAAIEERKERGALRAQVAALVKAGDDVRNYLENACPSSVAMQKCFAWDAAKQPAQPPSNR